MAIEVFISYAHEDQAFLKELAACRREASAPGLSWYTVEHEENI
jgi:hypothetical protein